MGLRSVVDSGCTRVVSQQKVAPARRGRRNDAPGMERFPMNLIEGTRSAWAAACRRARVANMVAIGWLRVYLEGGLGGRRLDTRCAGQSLME